MKQTVYAIACKVYDFESYETSILRLYASKEKAEKVAARYFSMLKYHDSTTEVERMRKIYESSNFHPDYVKKQLKEIEKQKKRYWSKAEPFIVEEMDLVK